MIHKRRKRIREFSGVMVAIGDGWFIQGLRTIIRNRDYFVLSGTGLDWLLGGE